ncbi:MAG: hypothetical protein NC429_08210 [Lachnospiraceae bacterium]|nr:hypothetical protein [Lachnospiraceae bacterium]
MTSFFIKKVKQISLYDMHVIVDNYVEMGDFSIFVDYVDKKCSLFFSECLQDGGFKKQKILIWSISRIPKLTKCVFYSQTCTERGKYGILFEAEKGAGCGSSVRARAEQKQKQEQCESGAGMC